VRGAEQEGRLFFGEHAPGGAESGDDIKIAFHALHAIGRAAASAELDGA
jgi:hypothetical protein